MKTRIKEWGYMTWENSKKITTDEFLIWWTALNVGWWLISFSTWYGYGIDLNPWASNLYEILINGVIWIVGIVIISKYID